jgi:ABC-type dipeptide/oligopeptide/nickel transport system permease subunit
VIKRLMNSRGMRKFLRNRLAVVASVVIAVYTLIAIAVVFGAIPLEDCKERVMPGRSYGFLQHPNEEQKFNELNWYVMQHLAPTLNKPGGFASTENTASGRERVALAERGIPSELTDEQVQERWEALYDKYMELDEFWLEREDLRSYIAILETRIERDTGDGSERERLATEIEELGPELVELDGLIVESIDETEADLLELLPIPTGWAGLKYGFRTFLGSDESGRSVSVRAFYSIKIAFQVGLVAALMSVGIGTILGGLAGFYGGWVDHAVMWLVSVLSSVPYLVLLAVLVYVVRGNQYFSSWFDNPQERPGLALVPVYAAFGLTFWIGTCRVIRGEVMKIKELEYVQAATAIGFGRMRILLKHVIPNTTHIMFINFSLIFIGAIKSEVILSFLGLGVQGQPSWGVMISLGREDVQNFFFWTVLSATALMFGLVLAFNIVSDALQDAFDPKHV